MAPGDGSGIAVSAAGDVNGDGLGDFLIGAADADPNGAGSGSSYLVFGRAGGFAATLTLGALNGADGVRLDGVASYDRSGFALSAAGDFNGDGFDDFLIGAHGSAQHGDLSGSSYLVFGKPDGFAATVDLLSLDGGNGFRLDGAAPGDLSGYALAAAGDVNGDGFDDLLIGAHQAQPNGQGSGAIYLVFGRPDAFGATFDLGTLDGGNGARFAGEAIGDYSGRAVSAAGDVNGDGFDDLLIGADGVDRSGTDAGASYVVFGKAAGFADTLNLADLDGSDGFRIDGVQPGERSGRAVSGAGDVNGDGLADLLIGAYAANHLGEGSGSSYVVFGRRDGFAAALALADLDGVNGFRVDGPAAGSASGLAVSVAGDVNGDGFGDLLIGAPKFDVPGVGQGAGASFVVFGKAGGFTATLDLAGLDGGDGLRLDGVAPFDLSGLALSAAGDVDGDGFDDMLVGAHPASVNGAGAGASFVIFGRDFAGEVDKLGTAGNDTLVGKGVAEILVAGRGNDVLDGGGGADVLKGGSGNDVLTWRPGLRLADGGSGTDLLRVAGAGVLLDFARLPPDSVRGIEVVDLTGSGRNALVLTPRDVLHVSDGGTLRVDGGPGDTVLALASEWTASAASPPLIGGQSYRRYTAGVATLLVDTDVTVLRDATGEAHAASLTPPDLPGVGAVDGAAGGRLIAGTGGNDRRSGSGAAETLRGLNGNDLLNGGAGADRLDGGNGSDTLQGGSGNDLLLGGAGNDVLRGEAGNDRLFGGAGDDRLFGGSGNDSLRGDAGNDVLRGEAGDDRLDGSAGDDQLQGEAGNDLLLGGSGNDRLSGGGGDDHLDGGAGVDRLLGEAGDDALIGGTGDDVLLGGAGDDRLDGGNDDDQLFGEAGEDLLLGGAGNEALVGGSGDDHLDGGAGNDTLAGDGGADVLEGGSGNDRLTGGAGQDILRGGAGHDVLIHDAADLSQDGGSGNDTLEVSGAGFALNAATLSHLRSIEVIDLRGSGANSLAVDAALVASLSGTGSLRVRAGADDGVFANGWTAAGQNVFDGITYDSFTAGATSLHIEAGAALLLNGVVALATLDGENGLRLEVEHGGDRGGGALSAAGDVNGDGFDDWLIGASGVDAQAYNAGASYLVFGSAGGLPATLTLAALDGASGVRFDGVNINDQSGYDVSGAGDVNGDGFDDVLIGAFGASPNGGLSGSSYVVFGKTGGFGASLDLVTLDGANGFRIDGEAVGHRSGRAVSAAGDVNGDGFDDVLVGAPGAAAGAGRSYVVFGKAGGFSATLNLSTLDGANGFSVEGQALYDQSGRAVSAAGDLNGDGFDDIVVGVGRAANAGSFAGSSYVIFGRSEGFAAASNLASLNGSNGFRLDGANPGDFSGHAVSSAGDVNGDGLDDLLIGAYGASPNGLNSGSSYVVFGRTDGFGSSLNLGTLDGSSGFRLDGGSNGDGSGRAVSAAGDINGDGYDDLLIGAPYAAADEPGAGVTYVVFGRGTGFEAIIALNGLDGARGLRLPGIAALDRSGAAVSGAGDVNGDGFDDLLVGARDADTNGYLSGTSYLVYGRDFTATVDRQGGDGADLLSGTSAAEVLHGGRGDDVLDGRGGRDVLKGGAGDDILVWHAAGQFEGGGGFDTLTVTAGGARLTGAAGVLGIEAVDLGGGAASTLVLDAVAVRRMTDAPNLLRVSGDADDLVRLVGDWTVAGTVVAGFTRYTLDGSKLDIADGLRVQAAGALALATLDGVSGLRLDGGAAGDASGRAVAGAGDVNGDGFDDLLIGARGASPIGIASGSSYVVFGKVGGFAPIIDLDTLDGASGFRLDGAAGGDLSGHSVSAAGDVNGDGFDDVLIGAHFADPNGEQSGASYLVFGRAAGFAATLNLGTLDGTNGFRLDGVAPADNAGIAVGGAGDFNGDGFDDLLIGAQGADPRGGYSGAAFLVFGRANGFPAALQLASLDGVNGVRLDGVAPVDLTGIAVSAAGDINGDGFDDLLIGARGADFGGTYAGASYVVFGRAGSLPATFDLASLDGTNGFRVDGANTGDTSGHALDALGDVNGDGFDDLLVGAFAATPNGTRSGSSYVVFGQRDGFAASFDLGALDGSNGFRLDGAAASDYSGLAVSGAGDVNGDGYADILIGAFGADDNGSDAGASYLVFGRADGFAATLDLGNLDGRDGFRLDGVAPGDRSGYAVSAAGDVDGDGFDDLLVGADRSDGAGEDAGASYVIFGRDFTGTVDLLGGDGADLLVGASAAEVLFGGRGNDVLDGGGGADVLQGGAGDDVLLWRSDLRLANGGGGSDTLRLTGSGVFLDFAQLPHGALRGIEVLDLTGQGGNGARLALADVLQLSDTHTLRIDGDVGDALFASDQGWTATPGGPVALGGQSYDRYTQGIATLLVDTDVSQFVV
ncbi:MAG: beta strand repeat-containing protein [Gammaproteobacteria bacterium]